jgi:hypothetical protein
MVAKGRPPPLSSFLLRYSDSSPFVCTFYDAASHTVQHMRIGNSDMGYSVLLVGGSAAAAGATAPQSVTYPTLLDLIEHEVLLKQYAASVNAVAWKEFNPQLEHWAGAIKLTPIDEYMKSQTKLAQQGPPIPNRPGNDATNAPATATAASPAPLTSSHRPYANPPVAAAAAVAPPRSGQMDAGCAGGSTADALRHLLSLLPLEHQVRVVSIPTTLSAAQEAALADAVQRVFAVPTPAPTLPSSPLSDTAASPSPMPTGADLSCRARLSMQTDLLAGSSSASESSPSASSTEFDGVLSPVLKLFWRPPPPPSTAHLASSSLAPASAATRIQVASIDLADPDVQRVDLQSPLGVQLCQSLPPDAVNRLKQCVAASADGLLLRWQGQIVRLQPTTHAAASPSEGQSGSGTDAAAAAASRALLARVRHSLDTR